MDKQAIKYLGKTTAAAVTAAFLLAGCAGGGDQHVAVNGHLQFADAGGGSLAVDSGVQLANAGEPEEEFFGEDNDPLELLNRFTFAFNDMVDTMVLQPAAATYRFLVPDPVQDGVRNVLRNLNGPVILANDLFQGEFDRAGDTAMRFLINSTIGLAGIFDVASEWGYEYHNEDFGQTLGTWGMGEGFYLVLPILGPSSLRDATGLVVDSFMDPWPYVLDHFDVVDDTTNSWITIGRRGLEGIDMRARNIETIEAIKQDAVDYYARMRTLYRQHRAGEIRNGEVDDIPIPGLTEVDWENDNIPTLNNTAGAVQQTQVPIEPPGPTQ